MERFLSSDALLITPTATMAEHLRNEMARSGAAVRPNRIQTIAQFTAARSTASAPSTVLLHLLIQQAIHATNSPRFRAIAQSRGLHRAIAELVEELPAGAAPPDLARILRHVENEIATRAFALRSERLRSVSTAGLPPEVIFDGFFSFNRAELDLITQIASETRVVVTLPEWSGAAPVRDRLATAGFRQSSCEGSHRRSAREVVAAPTPDREVEEIARRIIVEISSGTKFREIAVILRSAEPYRALIETTFARFGIPARFYFSEPLHTQRSVVCFSRLVDAVIREWDQETLLSALRMPASGIGATPEGDAFDFSLRAKLPSRGLNLNGPKVLESLSQVTWSRDRNDAGAWSTRLKSLSKMLPQDAALEQMYAVLDELATALEGTHTLADFWQHAELAISLARMPRSDRRRNVVHVMDVFEARQWELPIVFVCGMTERHFPQYHRENPLLDEATLRRAGLKSAADLQDEERFLFDIAISRATSRTVLTYPRYDAKGEDTIRSFFLEALEDTGQEIRIRPRSDHRRTRDSYIRLQDDSSHTRLSELHCRIAATSIESYLQCPFQFFAGRTLRLNPRPPAPRDRLDFRVQGSIIHRALAEYTKLPLLATSVLDEVFADECRRANIPLTYRTEAIRLELFRNFEAFTQDKQLDIAWSTRTEEKFSFALNPLVQITGRIDRLDIGPQNQALVIDYKYSAGAKVRERVHENDRGNLVQGGLYLAAAKRAFGLAPAGMLYCGLRKEVVWDGWHVAIPGLEKAGASFRPEDLEELIANSLHNAERVHGLITSGEIAARPADEDKCVWCDFRDMCRFESADEKLAAGAPSF